MMQKHCLLVPDVEAVRRKLAAPSPLLARVYSRFRARLEADADFRRDHIFLPALLGEAEAIAEAKARIVELASDPLSLASNQSPSSKATARESLDHHIWCVVPRAMRLAVYFTWLDAQGAWSEGERAAIAGRMLDFFDLYVVPVLRARVPGGHNQQFSMTFCSAVVGQAFADVEAVAARAQSLHDWALPKFKQVLGLMPASGYSGEGSTYQSDVVSGLVMWAGIFLEQLGETDVWQARHAPNGACLADTLKMESAMGSCGGLLPPWDHYGWARIHNLAARTLWAGLSGDAQLLDISEAAWDEESFIAWRDDDRLWTLLYWPERGEVSGVRSQVSAETRQASTGVDGYRQESPRARSDDPLAEVLNPEPRPLNSALSGWHLPAVGGAIEHLSRRLRVMSVWDRCAGSLQAVCRGQVNPNHLMIELGGEPISADGWEDGRERLVSDAALARTLESLETGEQAMICRQYGDVETWVRNQQHGFLGMASAIVVDGWDSYFPRQAREGRLVYEQREAACHTFAGEAAAYYQPALDITRMRRTVSMGTAGVTWIVDDVRADSAHAFAWRLWLRRGVRQAAAQGVRLDLASGQAVTLAWWVVADGVGVPVKPEIETIPTFPQGRGERYPWPDQGSDRCDVIASGRCVRFVTCLVPEGVDGLQVRETASGVWEAMWEGGQATFSIPPEVEAIADDPVVVGEQATGQHAACDLDEPPHALLDEPDAALLAALDSPPVGDWRRTGAAMQTLTMRGNAEALPTIEALLLDGRQNYTVHSVAAWCLGRARYAPALDTLRRMTGIPEDNTATRARWAVERLEAGVRD